MEKENKIIKSVDELFTHDFLVYILSSVYFCNDWYSFCIHTDTPKEVYKSAQKSYLRYEDICADVLLNGGYLLVQDVDDEAEYKLNLQDIIIGFKIFMLNYPDLYLAIMTKTADYYDACVIFQCAICRDIW